jgi:hypothetical protein
MPNETIDYKGQLLGTTSTGETRRLKVNDDGTLSIKDDTYYKLGASPKPTTGLYNGLICYSVDTKVAEMYFNGAWYAQ